MPVCDYAIEPVYGERQQDPGITRWVDAFLEQQGFVLTALPPIVVGWQLQLRVEAAEVERTAFAADGFDDAQQTGCAWLAQHGVDAISRCFVRSDQASRRMAWDHDYRRKIDQRGF